MLTQIAVVSNNTRHQKELTSLFKKEGLDVINIVEADSKNIDILSNISPKIIFLDLELKNTDGIEICYQLKQEKKVGSFVVILSNKPEEYIQIEAFKAGADDYMMKTTTPRVLIKKVKAFLKRAAKQSKKVSVGKTLSFKGITVDTETHEIHINNQKLYLPRKDFEILTLLLTNPHKTYSREEIYRSIWNNSCGFNARVIDVHIRKIREKLGKYLIETVKGVGYKLSS